MSNQREMDGDINRIYSKQVPDIIVMTEYVEQQIQAQKYYDTAAITSSRELIDKILIGQNEIARAYLVDNPYLTNKDCLQLAIDDSLLVRQELAKANIVFHDVIHHLTSDKDITVRVNAYCHALTPYSVFKDFAITEKLSLKAKQLLAKSTRVLENEEVFISLWETKALRVELLGHTYGAVIGPALDRIYGDGLKPSVAIDPKIFDFLHQEILNGTASNAVRVTYAGSDGVASPEVLDVLKNDPHRPVISAISRNSTAWTSTHEYILDNHKSSGLRLSMAMSSIDNIILNRIYRETKSKEIIYWIENNSSFSLL